MAVTTGDAVPGELIQASWGDAVRADLTALDNGKVAKAGDTMSGSLVMGGAAGITTSTGSIRSAGDPTSNEIGVMLQGSLGRIWSFVNTSTDVNVTLNRGGGAAASGANFQQFQRLGTVVGNITLQANLTSIAYNTTSDPRLKHRDGDATDAAALAARIGGAAFRGRWLHPDTGEPHGDEWILLSSHDVEDAAPYAVSGERDAVDSDGNMIPQQVSYPDLVPLLFAALANALERIETLEGGAT